MKEKQYQKQNIICSVDWVAHKIQMHITWGIFWRPQDINGDYTLWTVIVMSISSHYFICCLQKCKSVGQKLGLYLFWRKKKRSHRKKKTIWDSEVLNIQVLFWLSKICFSKPVQISLTHNAGVNIHPSTACPSCNLVHISTLLLQCCAFVIHTRIIES